MPLFGIAPVATVAAYSAAPKPKRKTVGYGDMLKKNTGIIARCCDISSDAQMT